MESVLHDIYDRGKTDLDYFRCKYPTIFFMHLDKIERHVQRARSALPRIPFKLAHPQDGPIGEIGVWWNKFIKTGYNEKKQNLWVWGPPNGGKTTKVLMPMMGMARGYEIFDDPVFWHPYAGPYDFAYCDEFKGLKPVEDLNKFMSPNPMHISTKGGVSYKDENLPVIILGNHSPWELYWKNAETLEALLARFTVVKLEESKDVF